MAETKERRKTPRKTNAATPKPGHELEDRVQAESEVRRRVERAT